MSLPGGNDYDLATVSNPSSALTDFTLMIDLSRMSSDFKSNWNTSANGYGRAAIHSGPTELACDWINLDHTAKTGWVRIKWSGTLASSGTQQLRIYPPNTSNSQYSSSDTYGSDNAYDSDWAGYWPDGATTDRTANGNDGTTYGSVSEVSGQIDTAHDYGGSSSDYTRIADDDALDLYDEFTIMFWANPDDKAQRGSFVHKYDSAGDQRSYFCEINTTSALGMFMSDNGVDYVYDYFTNNLSNGTYRHLAFTWTGGNESQLSENGGSKSNPAASSGTVSTLYVGTAPLDFGRSTYSTSRAYDGKLDDVQIHSASRSEAWIAEEYSQTNDQASFWGTWSWQGGGISASITEFASAVESSSATATFQAAINESAAASESSSASVIRPASAEESVSPGEGSSAVITITSSITESVSADESSSAIVIRAASVSESASASDQPSAVCNFVAAINEAFSTSEQSSVIATFSVSITESVSASEESTTGGTTAASITESASAVDSASATVQFSATITESANVDDLPSVTSVFLVSITESVNTSDEANTDAAISAAILESVSIDESISVNKIIAASIIESIGTGGGLTTEEHNQLMAIPTDSLTRERFERLTFQRDNTIEGTGVNRRITQYVAGDPEDDPVTVDVEYDGTGTERLPLTETPG